MKKTGRQKKWGSLMMTAALCFPSGTIQAQTLEYEAVTAMDTNGYCTELETLAKELVVDKVYAEAGSSLSEGDQILKFTEDSYQKALDYYRALAIQKANEQTNAQLEYDRSVQEAAYTAELAKAGSDQAEFRRKQSEKELESTIEGHEEALTNLEERIAELEEGISDGSYETSSATSGGGVSAGGGGASSGGSSKKSGASSGDGSNQKDEAASGDESDRKDGAASDAENKNGQKSGFPAANEGQGNGMPSLNEQKTENATAETKSDETMEELIARKTELEKKLEEAEKKYEDALKSVYALAEVDERTGTDTQDHTKEPAQEHINEKEQEGDAAGAENTSASEQLSLASTLADTAKSHAQSASEQYSNAETAYKEVLDTVQSTLKLLNMDKYAGYVDDAEKTAASVTGLYEEAISRFEAAVNAYEGAVQTLQSQSPQNSGGTSETRAQDQSAALEKMAALVQDLKTAAQERDEWKLQYEKVTEELEKAQQSTTGGNGSTESGACQNQPGGNESTENGTAQIMPDGTVSTDAGSLLSGDGSSSENTGFPSGNSGTTGAFPSGNSGTMGAFPSGNSGTMGAFPSGNSGAMGAFPSGMSSSMGSLPSGQASSGTSSAALPSSGISLSAAGNQASGMGVLQGGGSSDDDSLFGSTYDLSRVEALLEQEPSDTDAAEELVDELKEWQETVQLQYEELLRIKKATELKIQYTYDTTILDGKLAEITYQETLQELEETLQAAKDAYTEAEAVKEQLEAMTGGVLTAAKSGYVASVAYEEGDRFIPSSDVLSFYDTSEVTVSFEVPQENIADIAVGDTVSVDLGRYGEYTGTVSEKMPEASENSSRTDIIYEVTVSVENENGNLSAGISARIQIETAAEQEENENE